MTNSKDFLNRLRQASLPELVYRSRRTLRAKCLKWVSGNGGRVLTVPPVSEFVITEIELPEVTEDGRVGFASEVAPIPFSPPDEGQVGPDVRETWEAARLQAHFASMHRARSEADPGQRQRLLSSARRGILDWILSNPFPKDPHYLSPMEGGLRIPVFVSALKLLPDLSAADRQTILRAIYEHGWWVSKNLSLYASRGNHTICEAMGLVFAGVVFSEMAEGREWLKRGIKLLEEEIEHQILADGGPAEQSLAYHRFVLDVYWYSLDFLQANRLYLAHRLMARLIAAEKFLAAFGDPRTIPAIGDSDNGFAVAPGLAPRRYPAEAGFLRHVTFRETGLTLVRPTEDTRLTFDHGPLGMAPLHNHGHADALAITFWAKAVPILVDPGTFRYNGVPEHRAYFKGTSAHNTVTIDGQDQAVQETGFIWSKPFTTRLLFAEERGGAFLAAAEHDGYTRLNDPVWHRRSLAVDDHWGILIWDRFRGRGAHAFLLNFHLHPDVEAERTADAWRLRHGDAVVHLSLLTADLDFELVRGRRAPLLGWYSPAYGVLQETSTLSLTVHGRPDEVSFFTAIRVGPGFDRNDFLERALWHLQAA